MEVGSLALVRFRCYMWVGDVRVSVKPGTIVVILGEVIIACQRLERSYVLCNGRVGHIDATFLDEVQ